MSKLETNTIDTVSGTTNLTIGSTNTSTITVPNGKLTGQNYPAFFIIKSATQAISAATLTKVTFDGTLFDTDSGFDDSNDRWTVPSGKAGKYYISLALGHTNSIAQNADVRIEMHRYNSSGTAQQYQLKTTRQGGSSNHYGTYHTDTIWDCSVGDYFEIHFYCSDACTLDGNVFEGAVGYSNAEHTSFIGYRIGS